MRECEKVNDGRNNDVTGEAVQFGDGQQRTRVGSMRSGRGQK